MAGAGDELSWWIRPLVRLLAALSLPILVPAIITMVVWMLPGTLATSICPPGCARQARETTVAEYHLQSPWSDDIRASVGLAPLTVVEKDAEAESSGELPYVPEEEYTWGQYAVATGSSALDAGYFLINWLRRAVTLDFGRGKVGTYTAFEISDLIWSALPNTLLLISASLILVVGGMITAAAGVLPRRVDSILQGIGVVPAVFMALFVYAILQVFLGGDPTAFDVDLGTTEPMRIQPLSLIFGGLALGLADGAASGAVIGTRNLFESEVKQRYIGIAVLRGESVLGNALPNILPALVGQLRGRVLHLVSGTVIVELVLQINGLGDLLWNSTLDKATFVILAAAWGFSLISALLLLMQALSEVGVALLIRRAPKVPVAVPAGAALAEEGA